MNSQRQKKVSSLLQKEMSNIFHKAIRFSGSSNTLVSVTKVKISPDLSVAKVYISIYPSKNKDDYINSIVKVTGVIEEVCPMRGCWLQVGGENNNNKKIRFKVKDGDIVFPLSSKGRKVVAEGQFSVLTLNKKQAKNWKRHLAAEKGIDIDTASIVLTDNDYFEYRLNTSGAEIF